VSDDDAAIAATTAAMLLESFGNTLPIVEHCGVEIQVNEIADGFEQRLRVNDQLLITHLNVCA
jgi:hypothetical protein